MLRIRKNILHSPGLHYFSGIHHRYTVCHTRHHAKIMRDKHSGRMPFLLDLPEQIQNLCLNRHIKRGCRLVSDQNGWIPRQCDRKHRSLSHSSGKMVRKQLRLRHSVFDPHKLHQLRHFFSELCLRKLRFVHLHCLCDLPADRHRRI